MLIHIFPLNWRFLKPNFNGFLGSFLGLDFGFLWVFGFGFGFWVFMGSGFGFGFKVPNPTQKPTFFRVFAAAISPFQFFLDIVFFQK